MEIYIKGVKNGGKKIKLDPVIFMDMRTLSRNSEFSV